MAISTTWERYRYEAFKWRYERSLVIKIGLALGMACLTGVAAQVRFYLPWSPVPITGQTFAVLFAGVLLGRWWGGISMALYAAIGAAGLPWFAGFKGGIGVLTGPTGGYIFGFILAALFVGYFTDTFINSRRFFPMLGLMLFANFVLIHGAGLLQLKLWFDLNPEMMDRYSKLLAFFLGGREFGWLNLLLMGTIPFIPGDIIKAVTAALLTKGITPKKAYNGEIDKGRWRIP